MSCAASLARMWNGRERVACRWAGGKAARMVAISTLGGRAGTGAMVEADVEGVTDASGRMGTDVAGMDGAGRMGGATEAVVAEETG